MPTCPAGHDSASTDFCDVCGMRIEGTVAPAAPAPGLAPAGSVPAGGTPAGGTPAGGTPAGGQPAAAPGGGGGEPCPACGTARSGRFCESCGFDFGSGQAAGAGVPGGRAPAGRVPATTVTPPAATGPAAAPAPAAGTAGAAAAPGAGAAAAAGQPAPAAGTASPASTASPAWTAVVASDRAYFDQVAAAGGPDAAVLEFPAYCPERRFQLTGQEMRIGRHSQSRGLFPEIDLTGPPTDPGISRLHAVLMAQPDGGWAVIDPGSENGTLINGSEIATGVPVPLHDGDRIHLGAWTVITVHAG